MQNREEESSPESSIGLKTKVYLTDARGRECMGIGVVWLLQKIESKGSIKKAAEEMGLSYAKAHRIICEAEEGLHTPLIHRRRGGDTRRGADLTEEARLLIDEYSRLHNGIKKDASERFTEFLEKTGPALLNR
ncbi:MAG: winged helix-turn-helix domain-containing protein [Spirochaetaceae bacterium]